MIKTLTLFLIIVSTLNLYSQVQVSGYYRSNGTYVKPHVRTPPNSTITDNYSYPGNYNPNNINNTPLTNTPYTNYSSFDNSFKEMVESHHRTKAKSTNTNNSIDSYNRKYVIASQVNIRTSPEISNNILSVAKYGDEIQSVNQFGAWEQVLIKKYNVNTYNYETYTGYIYSNYLSKYSPVKSTVNPTSNSNVNSYYSVNKLKKYMVVSEKAYFHLSPNINNKKNAYLVYGESIQAIKESQYFVYIEFVNSKGIKTIGWIMKKDLIIN